jgi:ankyrin repeat protein
LAEGADPQVDYSPGNTDSLLHTAAYAGYTAICDALLKAGADIEGGNEYAVTPLLMSIWGPRSLDTVKYLIQRVADPNGTKDEDWTPLHFAVKFGYPGLVEFLIANGADPTLKTRVGDTPLMLAVKYGNKTRVRELLACGVDASLGEGRCTALEWVRGENVETGLTRADRCLRP